MIPVPDGELGAEHAAEIAQTFHDEHERLYTYCVRDMPVDLNAWRVFATGRLPELTPTRTVARSKHADSVLKETRTVFFTETDGYVDTPIYDGESLPIGTVIEGPAVAELPTTTLVLFPGHELVVEEGGNSVITIPAGMAGHQRSVAYGAQP
jgi:N-methylhydantoinase A